MNANHVTATLTEDNEPKWVYLINGVYYQQNGFPTEKEAIEAGEHKIKELKKSTKKTKLLH